jgi:hypothetical protein
MTPEHFIATWKDNPLTERAGDGWADVLKRGHFGWEKRNPAATSTPRSSSLPTKRCNWRTRHARD